MLNQQHEQALAWLFHSLPLLDATDAIAEAMTDNGVNQDEAYRRARVIVDNAQLAISVLRDHYPKVSVETVAMIDIGNALERARADFKEGRAAWVPIFVDVIMGGKKIGHITSDGYTNQTWRFFPIDKHRRERSGSIRDVLPLWCLSSTFANAQTYREKFPKDAAAESGS